ncbi:hypothetical protein KOJCDNHJ_04514 (plasmid) [Xanthomonas citri pv. punicae]|nr:hypothetical protein KOJCDNHJ_04514 [Xanthomonas citri pv. punicae]
MARSGLYKSDVQRARDRLRATGTHPSVDAVRVALGNTGSKTTPPLFEGVGRGGRARRLRENGRERRTSRPHRPPRRAVAQRGRHGRGAGPGALPGAAAGTHPSAGAGPTRGRLTHDAAATLRDRAAGRTRGGRRCQERSGPPHHRTGAAGGTDLRSDRSRGRARRPCEILGTQARTRQGSPGALPRLGQGPA